MNESLNFQQWLIKFARINFAESIERHMATCIQEIHLAFMQMNVHVVDFSVIQNSSNSLKN